MRSTVSGSRALRFSAVVVSVIGSGMFPVIARAAEPEAPRLDARAADPAQEARTLFAQGQVHYSLGEYEQAIGAFRRAYELTSAPGLLFNVAQAHRLAGHCKEALEVYRHFTRLVPDSEYRGEADTHVASLIVQCGTAPNTVRPTAREPAAPVEISTVPTLQLSQGAASSKPPGWSTGRRTAAALLAAGVGAGLAAGSLYWWNDGRYDRWRDEDRRLVASASGTAPGVWAADQERNDALLHSVQKVDTVSLTLAGLSVAAIVASALLVVVFER